MKSLIIYVIFFAITFIGCEKMDLPRDNPNDKNQNGIALTFSRYVVNLDDNNDKIINAGETIYLIIYLKNEGQLNANGVKASIFTNSPFISDLSPTTDVGYTSGGTNTIVPNEERYGFASRSPVIHTLKFKVDINTTHSVDV